MLRSHGGDLHHCTPQVALEQAQAALGRERPRRRAQDALVQAGHGTRAPNQAFAVEEGFLGVAAQAGAGHGGDILVQQTGVEQLADQQRGAAGGVEVVDVGLAVGIDVGQGRHHLGQLGHVLPGQLDAGGLGDGRQVQAMVGRATGGVQRHHRIDQAALVDQLPERQVVPALAGQARRLLRRRAGQGIAQRRAGVDEGGAGQVQAHDLHQHLVGIGGAVEGAGAGAVVGLHLRLQQFVTAGLALGEALAHGGLVLVRQPRRHRPGRHEQGRQVAEAQRADQQAGNDLVAHAQAQRGIEHVVRQRHGGAHGDHLAAGQAQLHARLALGHAVAHGRHPARHLTDRADLVQRLLDQRGKALVGLVRRQHVVVGADDGHVGRIGQAQGLLVMAAATGHAVGEVGALQLAALRPLGSGRADQRQVVLAGGAAALDQALGDFQYTGMHRKAPLFMRTLYPRRRLKSLVGI